MDFGTLSADIVSYTSLTIDEKEELRTGLDQWNKLMEEHFKESGFFGRRVQGDFIECVVTDPTKILRISLLLKTYVKSFRFDAGLKDPSRLRHFSDFGVRIALAVAPLESYDPTRGLIDGEAIYLSGREVKEQSTSYKKKVSIKRTMFFRSNEPTRENTIDVVVNLLDSMLNKCSARQCEVLYYKLLCKNEKEIGKILRRSQSTISQHSSAAGWHAIESSVKFFEKLL